MNKTETSQLLTLAALVDNRAITPEMVVMWHGLLDDISYEDAAEALKEHYRTSTRWLMPAHLRDLVAAAQAEAKKAPGREIAARRQWLLDNGIDYLAYEAGDPEAIAAAEAAKTKQLTHERL